MTIIDEKYCGAPITGVYMYHGRAVIDSTMLSGLMQVPHDDIIKQAARMGMAVDTTYARPVVHFDAKMAERFLTAQGRPDLFVGLDKLMANAEAGERGKKISCAKWHI